MRVVVVGAGLAGLRTAEALRDKGFAGELVLVGDEVHLPYDRPPLSKHVLRGERDPVLLRPEAAYAELALDLRLGVAATGLDLQTRRVLTGHDPIPFDQLVIATGATPRRLPGSPGHVLRTLDDAQALAPLLAPGRVIGVVGAGLIGCEVAASARAKGAEVHVVDLLPRPLVRVLGDAVAARVQALHEEHGVRFHLATSVVQASAAHLELGDGTVLDLDALLEAMGVVPTTGWLATSGLTVDDGVVCDENGRATDGVWAVGDVARWGSTRHEHWTSATRQAEAVAAGVLGLPPAAGEPPYWWSDQYDVKLQGLGRLEVGDDVVVVETGPRKRPLAVYSRGGLLSGAVGFSNAAAVFALKERFGDPLDEVLATLG
ncbi:MAG TPA: FAD-dependent oxidoreductase [Mycobacteriales bacterium]|nr:FAD-dependent oxidoreductase [Mycobacteriales bacterium]